jgi:hypothetical protein
MIGDRGRDTSYPVPPAQTGKIEKDLGESPLFDMIDRADDLDEELPVSRFGRDRAFVVLPTRRHNPRIVIADDNERIVHTVSRIGQ